MIRQAKLIPAYVILGIWSLFTIALVAAVVLSSLSTTKEIFTGSLLASGFHFENFVTAWKMWNIRSQNILRLAVQVRS